MALGVNICLAKTDHWDSVSTAPTAHREKHCLVCRLLP